MKKLIYLLTPLLMLSPFMKGSLYSSFAKDELYVTVTDENGNTILTGVNDNTLSEYRIYASNNIDIIDKNAFSLCDNITSIMISNNVSQIEQGALDITSLKDIIYTGSETNWNLIQYQTTLSVTFYGYDEGFINYWNEYVRPTKETSICNVSKDTYQYVYNLYNNLSSVDKTVIDAYKDKNDISIKDSMKFLNSYFNNDPTPSNTTHELKQGTTLRLVIYIAIFGMTTICIFFLLKTKKFID